MNAKASLALPLAGAYLVLGGALGALGGGLWIELERTERQAVAGILAAHAASALTLGLLVLVALGIAVHALIQRYVVAPRRVAEEAQLILSANPLHRIGPRGSRELRALAQAINSFAERHAGLQQEIATRVGATTARLEEEKNRLAALMSELTQSVLVCNVEGRILLYNHRARDLFHGEGHAAGGMVGLGRSIFAVIERNHIAHALDALRARVGQGGGAPVVNFVTSSASGQLIRVRMAPVLGAEGSNGISGYVLTLEDVTREMEADNRRDAMLNSLTEGSRSPLASIRAAVENLLNYPDIEPERQRQFLRIVSDEAEALGERVKSAVAEYADALRTQLPLEEILGADLMQAAERRIAQQTGVKVRSATVADALWLNVDSYGLVQALSHIARRVHQHGRVEEIELALERSERMAQLDVRWRGPAVEVESLSQWEAEPFSASGQASSLSLRDLNARHGGESWYRHDRASGASCYRLLLHAAKTAAAPMPAATEQQGRPEFYDFDLFNQPGQNPELDQRPLTELAYTVFDTETTGLDPSSGDEIISIGAVRILNGRLLPHELYDQLIDPQRAISRESVEVHGIEPAMLVGQPLIAMVLPAFLRFCEDTVLVAHNAAFDMRFLQMKEAATGIEFSQPVLDTLLLAAVALPNQDGHSLEAVAAHLGVNVVGRHTALGDALVTGEVFLKLLPLLLERGIRTLRDAREAARQTYYARLKY